MEKKKNWQYESVKRAKAAYDKRATTGLFLKFNNNTDIDILEKLHQVGNKQGYIKELIRKDISKAGN